MSNRILINAGFLIGTAAVIAGCGIYAKGIGRSPAWGMLGILSIPGFYVLSLLRPEET